jgi:hypothetical protein
MVVIIVGLTGCASSKYLSSMNVNTDKVSIDDMYSQISSIIVENGFDVKLGNKDLGLITTEYKKFGEVTKSKSKTTIGIISFSGGTTYDLLLQIKIQVKKMNGNNMQIILTPTVKEQNTEKTSDYVERQLIFIEKDDREIKFLTDEEKKQNIQGFLLFMKIAENISTICGLTMEQMEGSFQLSK